MLRQKEAIAKLQFKIHEADKRGKWKTVIEFRKTIPVTRCKVKANNRLYISLYNIVFIDPRNILNLYSNLTVIYS